MRKGGLKLANVNKLKGKIVECGLNVPTLAKKLGIDKATLYRKLSSGGGSFTIKEANIIVKELKLSEDEANAVFFS